MSTNGDSSHYVRLDRKGGVAEVVLNRGKELNKMDDDFFESFHEAITSSAEDPEVRVILIWAEGPLFTAGLDLFKAGPALTSRTTQFFGTLLAQISKRFYLSLSLLCLLLTS